MKNSIYLTVISIVFATFITSCNDNTSTNGKSKKDFTYLDTNTTLKWTAYKTTDKLGVKGTFNQIIVENDAEATTLENLINTTKFKTPTVTVFTGNAPRDVLIHKYFFGAMINTDTIYGKFYSAKDGKGLISIKMNNVEFKNDFTYSFKNDSLKINASLLLDNWNGYTALSSLHEQCFDKHTGPDGVSKTWPDVDLEIISVLKK